MPVPSVGRYLFFSVADAGGVAAALQRLAAVADGTAVVAGIGPTVAGLLGATVPGLREFPALSGHGVDVPSTPVALLCWLRGDDRGELVLRTHSLARVVAPGFALQHGVDAFRYGGGPNDHGRDLTGYEDGTENPEGDDADAAAFVHGVGACMDGSSFLALQRWVHDFDAFDAMPATQQDAAIGRRRSDNEELDDAPASAHVKRTAQESFEPEAFVLRRSMPWSDGAAAGLMFAAFGKSLDAFEAQMRRMAGLDDGITDAMFGISRPVSGAYLWCPPMHDGRLDLRQIGL